MTDERYILVLGGSSDGQLRAVVKRLEEMGTPCLFIDHATPAELSVSVDREGCTRIRFNGRDYGEPSLMWGRLKINGLLGDWGPGADEEYVRRSEWRGLLTALACLYRDISIYPMSRAWEAESQLLQFRAAGKAGFIVPRSRMVVGHAPAKEAVAAFANVIAKPLVARNVPKGGGDMDHYRVLMTMAVSAEDVADNPEEFDGSPTYFQERIMSGVEHRVLAFRERAFSYAIRQRVETRVRPDERIYYGGEVNGQRIYGAQYIEVETSSFVQRACAAVLKELEIEYGAFDIILVDTGEVHFIECNPEGMWFAAHGRNVHEVVGTFAEVLTRRLHEAAP